MSTGMLCGFTPITFCRKLSRLQVTRGHSLRKLIKGKHEFRRTSTTLKNENKKNKSIKRTVSSQISSIEEDSSPSSVLSCTKRVSTSSGASTSPSSVKNVKKKVKTHDLEDSSSPKCTANFILMVELRKNIFAFRDIIDLPCLDGSLSVNEIMKQTMKDLQTLSPEIVNINKSFEMEGAEMDKMLIFFYEDLRAIGDSWIMDSEWIYRSKYKNSGVGKNKSDRLVEHVLAALDGLIKTTRERFGMMDIESIDGRKSFFSSEGRRSLSRSVSYSESNNSFYSSPLTPRSVLPGPMMISNSNSTSPSLWNLRAQALDKLSPVDLKQLALQMLTRRDSGSVYDLDFKDEIIEEVEEGKKVAENEEEEDDHIKGFETERETETKHIKCSETEHEIELEHHTKPNEKEHETEVEHHTEATETEHKIEVPEPEHESETGDYSEGSETEHETETKHHINGSETEHETETGDHSEGSETEDHSEGSETEHETETKDHNENSETEHETETKHHIKCSETEHFFDATEIEYETETEQHIEVREAKYEIKTEDHIETVTSETNVRESSQEEVSVNQLARPSPPPPPTTLSQPPPPTLPQLENKAPPPPPPPSNTHESEGFCQVLKPQFVNGGSGKRTPTPPAPPGSGRSLRAKKATTKLRRSAQIASLYRVLKGKVEGRNVEARKTKESKETKIVTEKSSVKGGMADALAEMTKRSSYFQQIEEDVHKYTKSVDELKSSIQKFQTKDMKELLEFHSEVESVLEKLSDETQVLARFEGFPEKKLEGIRTAGGLYKKLDGILVELKNWNIEPPLNDNLDKIERYFNKVKGEIETVERTKDEEAQMFQRYNINIDFQVLVQIKETMVDISSNCMELALKERREANEEVNESEESKMNSVKAERGKRLWRAFQFAFKVYTFAGGHDERADHLTKQLAEEIQTDPEQIDPSVMF